MNKHDSKQKKNLKVSACEKKQGLELKHDRITVFVGGFSGGGAERVACNLANYLCDSGYQVNMIGLSPAPNEYELSKSINKVYLIDRKERTNKIHDFLVIRKRLKEYVVKNQDMSCYVVFLPVMIALLISLRKYTKSRIIMSERNAPTSYGLMMQKLMKRAARKCDGLVVQTREISDWYGDVKNKAIIQNAINKDIVFPKRERVKNKIVAVGRLEVQKNYPDMIKAFAIYSKKFPNYHLEIYGKGDQEDLIRNLIQEYGLGGKVKLMGFSSNVSQQIADAGCFVMTSSYEGMPNALIEAMCVGLPCVVTDCDGGGARALIKNGENGLLIKSGDIDGLAHGIEKVMSDDNFAKKLSKNAILLRNELAYDKIYGKWRSFIEEIIK